MVEKVSQIEVTILFFAYLRDATKLNSIKLNLPVGSTVGDLKGLLTQKYPSLVERLPQTLNSINRQFVNDAAIIPANAEVAFFPPVSGGDKLPTLIRVSETKVDLNEIISRMTNRYVGGICIFHGIIRGSDPEQGGHETQSLEYQAYIPMAQE
jgi:molybdopterin converting factor subunit 1